MAAMATTSCAAGPVSMCPSLTVGSEQTTSHKSPSVFWGHSLTSISASNVIGAEAKKYRGPVCVLEGSERPALSRRGVLAFGGVLLPLLASQSALAILEVDEDEELLEKVKEARKERLAKQQEINDYNAEKSSVQKAVFKLSRAGQLLDSSDYAGAAEVLGTSLETEWIKDLQAAFDKVGAGELSTEAVAFTSALSSLQTAVSNEDAALSKKAFVSSASTLESWTKQAGFASVITGL